MGGLDDWGLAKCPIANGKSACGKVSRVRHMVPGGLWESLPKRKVRFADQPDKTLLAAEETGYHLTGMLGQVSADGAVRITLIDHVQATDGGTQFVVTEAELTV
jgi:hypothetical protein